MTSPEDALMSAEATHHWLEAAKLDVEAASESLATLEIDLRAFPGPGVVTIPSTVPVQREIILLQATLVRVVGEIERRCDGTAPVEAVVPKERSSPGQLAVRSVRAQLTSKS